MKRLVRVAARRLREYISGVSVATPHVAGPTPEALIEAATFLFRQFDAPTFERFRLEFLTNDVFFDLLNHRFLEHRKRRHPLGSDTGYVGKFEYLYLVVRAMRPNLVVETGVFDGISSSVILQALQDANAGKLVSVDLLQPTWLQVQQIGWVTRPSRTGVVQDGSYRITFVHDTN